MGAVILAGLAVPGRAQDPDDLRRGVARVSLLNGEVSIQRGDSGDWEAASLNAPLVTNDHLSTGSNARTEVQFDSANLVRIGGNSDVSMTQLESARYQMAVAHGTVTFRVLRSSGIDVEVDTPSVSVRPLKEGAYRITVDDSGETQVTARSGEVEVFTPQGSQWVRSGQTLLARGSATDPEFQMVRASAYDEWDRWNDSRDQFLTRSVSAQYVGPGVYGVEDLDPYGSWVDVPGYGNVWRPLVVADWAPYRQGRWVWEDWYGWTWVSYEPWGWAPYHYGRWFYEPAFGWCWYPGAIGARHYWAPGLVAFFGFGSGGGVGFGFGNVGWVPLAPYEVLHPWWGRGYYGGPGYVNRSIQITNINITNTYRNARLGGGVTAVTDNDFRAGRFHDFVRVSPDQIRQAGIVRGQMPIGPSASNLHFSDRPAAYVPRSAANPKFFTRRQPNPAPSVPFSQQRRAFEQSAGANRGRFGEVSGQGLVSSPQAPVSRTDTSGGQRLAEERSNTLAPRSEAAAPPANRGWNRFGDPAGAPRPQVTQPRSESGNAPPPQGRSQERGFSAPSRSPAVQPAGPAYRERPAGGGGGSAPPRSRESSPPSSGNSRGNSGNGNNGGNHGGNRR